MAIFIEAGAAKWPDPEMSRGWPIPYDPTQRIYQRPGQAIFSKKRPDGHFIKASWLPGSPKRGSFRALASSNGRFVETGSPREGPSERWPANGHFYQRGSSQGASPLGLSHGWQTPYDPTQRIYQQPGQAIFSQKQPNGRFIKTGSPREGPSERWPASGHFYQRGNSQMARPLDLSRGQAIFSQKRPSGHFYRGRSGQMARSLD